MPKKRPLHYRSTHTAHRRFFWKVDRQVPNWWSLPDDQVRKLLRQWSWRRNH